MTRPIYQGFCRAFCQGRQQFIMLLVTLATVVLVLPARAAERVVLKYNILQASLSVAELRHLAQTGEASPSLKVYLAMVNKEPRDLQRILAYQVSADSVFLSKMLNSFAGEFLLEQIGTAIHTPSKRAGKQALRGAIVSSALADGHISLIEVLENYPTSEIYVEGDRLAELYTQLKGAVEAFSRLEF